MATGVNAPKDRVTGAKGARVFGVVPVVFISIIGNLLSTSDAENHVSPLGRRTSSHFSEMTETRACSWVRRPRITVCLRGPQAEFR